MKISYRARLQQALIILLFAFLPWSCSRDAITVSPAGPPVGSPDLAISKTHAGTFTQGQTGAAYTITVTNVGTASTSGTVTATDTLPTGLTATALSGSGWTCTLSSLTCTRSDGLATSASYPAITLTVNVASNAPAIVTNTATVSGGGDTNAANNTASDAIVVGTSTVNWPLRISSGKYLEDQSGVPFLIIGDSAQSISVQLSQADIVTYLNDRQSKGFTAIKMNLIEKLYGAYAPNNINNDAPFANVNDWSSTPGAAYWSNIDYIFTQAKNRGIVVLAFISYLGWDCGNDGWCTTINSQTSPQVAAYGTFLGNRYKTQGNIIWVNAGDENCIYGSINICSKITAIHDAISAVDTNRHLFTATSHNNRSAMDDYNAIVDINSAYAYNPSIESNRYPWEMIQSEYQRATAKPLYFDEGLYENSYASTLTDWEHEAFAAHLGGALVGQVYGHCPMCIFGAASGSAMCDSSPTWQSSLSSPGAISQGNIGSLMRSRKWWALVPDYGNTVVTSSKGTGTSYKATARETTGKTVMVWNPTTVSVTVDMTKISGTQANVWWYNPDDNSSTFVGTYPTTGTRNFTPGSARKVLVLDDGSLNLAAPGTTMYAD